jgi:uncharacterized membrane protein
MKRTQTSKARRGLALLVVFAVMAVLSVVLATVTFNAVAQRNMAQQRQHRLQADWLARAGIDLAAARLLEKPAAFTEELTELVPGAKVGIVVADLGKGEFSVTADAESGRDEELLVVRSAIRHFRRTEENGSTRLEVVVPKAKETP